MSLACIHPLLSFFCANHSDLDSDLECKFDSPIYAIRNHCQKNKILIKSKLSIMDLSYFRVYTSCQDYNYKVMVIYINYKGH